jgi:hypothetical protein
MPADYHQCYKAIGALDGILERGTGTLTIRDGVQATSAEINTARDLLESILRSVGLLFNRETIPVPTPRLNENDVRVRKISFNSATSGENENLAPDPILLVLKSAGNYLRMNGINLFEGAEKLAGWCCEAEDDESSISSKFSQSVLPVGQIGDVTGDASFGRHNPHDPRQHHSMESPPMTEIVIIRRDENLVNCIGSSRPLDIDIK